MHRRLLAICIVVSIFILLISRIDTIERIEKNLGFFLSSKLYFFQSLREYFVRPATILFRAAAIEKENLALKEENKRLLELLLRARENRPIESSRYISAEVSAVDSQLAGVLIIDRGLNDDIDDGRLVIDESFTVVGITYESSERVSKVKTLHAAGLTFNVANFENTLVGSAKTLGLSGIEVNFVDPELHIRVDDYLLTASQDVVFPSGYLVGKVAKVEKIGAFLKLKALPLFDFNQLHRVYVLTQ